MQRRAAEHEVDQTLEKWWFITHRMNRALWLLVPVLFFFLWAGNDRGPRVEYIPLAAAAWALLPMMRLALMRRKRPLTVVLWLRRFHRGSQSQGLLRFWESVARPWGQVITLSDEDVRRPATMTVNMVFLSATIVPAILIASRRQMTPVRMVEGFFVLTCFAGAYAAAVLFVIGMGAITKLRKPSAMKGVVRLVRRLRGDRILMWSGGSGVVHCPRDSDEVWQAAISALAPEVGVVIIDYGDGPSRRIDWEVETLLRLCGPGKMILAIPDAGPTQAERPLPTEMESALRRLFGASPPPQVALYPQRVPRLWVQQRLEKVVRSAQRMVGVAALTTARAGDSQE